MNLKSLLVLAITVFATNNLYAAEGDTDISIYTGTFDVIDKEGDDKTSLFGVEHKNPDLFRDTFLGKLSPITGFMMTADSASYFYTGVQAEYKIGKLNLTPSFSPGLYSMGDGKDLGSPLEFKSELQLSVDLLPGTKLGYSQSHLSNADLGDTNPGADSYMFNFMKSF